MVDEIGYFWNVRKYGDKILSLVTWERSNETNYRFRVWNISMETGQQWNTGEAVLELSEDSLEATSWPPKKPWTPPLTSGWSSEA